MRYVLALLLSLVAVASLDAAPAATVPTPLPPTSDDEAAAFSRESRDALTALLRDSGYTGGVLLLAKDGHLLLWQAVGHRDLAHREAMRRDDIFRLYSMTKPIATVAVMQLVEQGRIALDDPIATHLPVLAALQVLDHGTRRAPNTPLTIRHLLTHTGGFAAGLPGDEAAFALLEAADPSAAGTLEGVVAKLATVPLATDPGVRFGYEAAPLEILARLVEVVSQQPFDAYLRQHVFEPLRMRDTYFRVPAAKRARVVDLTVMGDDGRLRLDDSRSAREPGAPLRRFPSAAGGLYSTAADYTRFCQMLLDGGTLDGHRLLRAETVDAMMTNQLTMLEKPVTQFSDAEGFGFGGYVVLDPIARGVPGSVGQWGWTGAASTSFWLDRSRRLAGILLLQHLPNGAANDLPRLARPVQARVHEELR